MLHYRTKEILPKYAGTILPLILDYTSETHLTILNIEDWKYSNRFGLALYRGILSINSELDLRYKDVGVIGGKLRGVNRSDVMGRTPILSDFSLSLFASNLCTQLQELGAKKCLYVTAFPEPKVYSMVNNRLIELKHKKYRIFYR